MHLLVLSLSVCLGVSVGSSAAQSLPDSLSGGVVVDDDDSGQVEITAYWTSVTSHGADGLYGGTALHDGGTGADGVVRFMPEFSAAGQYDVYLNVPSLADRPLATNVPVDVVHAAGVRRSQVDMRASAGRWVMLGRFFFAPGTPAYVEIRNDAADGPVVADAVVFVPVTSK